jgi:hypothetical protein
MSSNEIIERLVVDLSNDSLNPEKNLSVAIEYEKLGQTASAVGFYLRAAEYGYRSSSLTTYAALLRVSICIEGQKNRDLTVSNVILQAIAYMPNRPEAYLLMSKFHEKSGNWQESYTFAQIGLLHARQIFDLPVDVGYPGKHVLDFQSAIAAWWVGRRSESIEELRNLLNYPQIGSEYVKAIKENLERLDPNETAI